MALALRNGLWIEQNRAVLRQAANISLIHVGDVTAAAELVDFSWRPRQDVPVSFSYAPREGCAVNVRDLLEACGCVCERGINR